MTNDLNMTFNGKTGEFTIVGKDPSSMLKILKAIQDEGSKPEVEAVAPAPYVPAQKKDKRLKNINRASHLTKWLPEEIRSIAENDELSYPAFKRKFGQQHPESSFKIERSKIRAVLKKGDYNTGYYYSRKERIAIDPFIRRQMGNSVFRPFATATSPELA